MERKFGIQKKLEVVRETRPLENENWFVPFPAGTPGVLKLADVIADDPTDTLTFHCIGDSGGIKDPNPQLAVAKTLVRKQQSVSFLYHVGDVVYFNGDASEYYPQFYEPYEHYNLPIFAIPGNHDGDNSDDTNVPSLTAFIENFCATSPHLTPESQDSQRDAMTQPYVYWALECNLAYIVGLYTNVPSGGVIFSDQAIWAIDQIKSAPTDRPLIVALHHPPYSADAHHGGSAGMADILDHIFKAAGRYPEMVIAGHVHNYQRFERVIDNKKILYIVNGTGGYHNLHEMARDADNRPIICPWVVPNMEGLSLQAYCDNAWGLLQISVLADKSIHGSYISVDRSGVALIRDTFVLVK